MILAGMFSSGNTHNNTKDRDPWAAGKFYTDDSAALRIDLKNLFEKALPRQKEKPRALIVPHAGYAYSGQVAASGFNQLDPNAEYENIFIIASSHRVSFEGASIYDSGDYVTPLGKVEVNRTLAKQLHDNNKVFSFENDAHITEHSLEVQLPFLQFHLKKPFKIVPVIIGVRTREECPKIAQVLKPWFNEKNLFVISTDFSHYPSYKDALIVDEKTADAITKNRPEELSAVMRANREANIPQLSTSLCGWSSVYTLLHLTGGNDRLAYKKIQYMNSGDQLFGDQNNVVGYHSIIVYEKNEQVKFSLNSAEKKKLLGIARHTIDFYLAAGKKPVINGKGLTSALLMPSGAFVTLYKEKKLRGCIGRFTSEYPLYQLVQEMAIAASTADKRFEALTESELRDVEIEISVISPLKKIASIDEIELGKHGIFIRKGCTTGTFLPQVAVKTGWDLEEFIGHCAKEKAGIGWDGWKDAELFTYEACIFGENEHNPLSH